LGYLIVELLYATDFGSYTRLWFFRCTKNCHGKSSIRLEALSLERREEKRTATSLAFPTKGEENRYSLGSFRF